MQTRRDQLHAYRFQTRRALAALVTGEPNVLEPPMRRLTAITISGIMVAILIGVGAAVVGLIKPSSGDKWKAAGAIIDERGTGARYVLFPDDVLHPVLNYSSAVLVVGGQNNTKPHIVYVDSGDIKSAKRGSLIGIPGLPDSVPGKSGLTQWPWTVCGHLEAGTTQHLNATVRVTAGGSAGARTLAPDAGVYVQAPSGGDRYLLADGRRYTISADSVATALDLTNEKPLVVGTAFLNAVPAGPALSPPPPDHVGDPSSTVSIDGSPATVGQLLYTSDSHKYYLVLSDGIAALTPLETDLYRTLPLDGQTRGAVTTSENAVLNIKASSREWSSLAAKLAGLPSEVPQIDPRPSANGGVCAVYHSSGGKPTLAVPASREPTTYVPSRIAESATSAAGVADSVSLPPGKAALVKSADGSATSFLVAAPGKKFAIPSAAVLSAFGYSGATPTKLPSALLALIAVGAPLDPTNARRPVSG